MARLDGTKLGAATALAAISLGALGAACSSSVGRVTSSSGDGHGGAANQGGSKASSTSVVTTGNGGNGGNGGAAAGCNPPAAAGSLWELQGLNYPDFQPVSLCKYRGDVTLIVNTAAI